jgi:thiol-disulfide isomerase/thioredoxin
MRGGVLIVLSLIAGVWPAGADEKLPELKVGINTYSNVTVTTVTATDIYFTHAGGMGNAKLKQLSPDLQKRFGYDAQQAAAVEQKRTAANAQYRAQAVKNVPAPRAAENDPAPTASEKPAAGLSWGTDLPAALNQARSENKMVLLDFTGSDWCGWCMKFDQDVLSTPAFAGYAKENLVLVVVDFPQRQPQSAALKEANRELKNKYRVRGFPTFVVLNAAGKEIGRQTGYAEGGPDAFIAQLKAFGKK